MPGICVIFNPTEYSTALEERLMAQKIKRGPGRPKKVVAPKCPVMGAGFHDQYLVIKLPSLSCKEEVYALLEQLKGRLEKPEPVKRGRGRPRKALP